MENFIPTHLQEIIYSSSDKKVRKQIALLENTGKIKKIAPRIFTSNFVVFCVFDQSVYENL